MRHKAAGPVVLVLLLLFATGSADSAPAGLTEQQKITHILNRIGFGPRPGDVERIQRSASRTTSTSS